MLIIKYLIIHTASSYNIVPISIEYVANISIFGVLIWS